MAYSKASCAVGSTDWNCCSDGNPCNKGEGDCDKDSHCAAGLKCGKDNCKDFNPAAHSTADCCYEAASCAVGSTDWNCCSDGSPCNKGEGDCDKDSHCAAGLKC